MATTSRALVVGFRGTCSALLCLFLTARSALGADCFAGSANAGAGDSLNRTDLKGLFGVVDLVSAQPVNPNLTSIVHPAQILIPGSFDFVGWGTYKGLAPTGRNTNVGTLWKLYQDAMSFGVYQCNSSYGSEPDVAPNQGFEIRHTDCLGLTRWKLFWNSNFKTCVLLDGVRGVAAVAGESVNAQPQKIDVHFEQLQYRILGGTWTNWTTANTPCNEPGYFYSPTSGGSTDWWFKKS